VPRVVAGGVRVAARVLVVVRVHRPVFMPVEPTHQALAPSPASSSDVIRNSSPDTTSASKPPQPPQANTGTAPTSVNCPHDRHLMRAGTNSTLIREPASGVSALTSSQQYTSVSGTIWRNWPARTLMTLTARPAARLVTMSAIDPQIDSSCTFHTYRRSRRPGKA